MYEFHGWATIHESPVEVNAGHLDEIFDRIQFFISQLKWSAGLIDLRWTNGIPFFCAASYRNHADSVVSELFKCYQLIAELAPGSYGILYVRDDEFENQCKVYMLVRGQLLERGDPFLTPCIPVIEDPS